MNHEFWYLSRAAGFTAYITMFTSVALGLLMTTKAAQRTRRQQLVFDMHRFLSVLAVAFSLFHVYVLLGDQYFSFNVWQLSVPFASPYRTAAVAAGVVSLYALLLVTGSFWVRKWIGYRTWRSLHFITFAMYAGVTLHAVTAGTDTTQPWARLLYVSTGITVLALLAYRLQHQLPASEPWRWARVAAGSAAAVFTLGVLVGTNVVFPGPAQSAAVVTDAATSPAATTGSAAAASSGAFLTSFSGTLNGTYTQNNSENSSALSVQAQLTGDLSANLNIDLAMQRGDESSSAQVSTNSAQLLDPATNAVICDGQLTSFNNGDAALVCTGAGPYAGVRMTIHATLSAAGESTVVGDVSGQMARLS
jgi:cytochrome b561